MAARAESNHLRTLVLCLLLAAMCGACGGGGRPDDPADTVIATVGGRELTRRHFIAYLAATLGGQAEADKATSELKSRLLDQFLDEELLVSAAQQEGLTVTDDEVKGFQPSGGSPDVIRRILTTSKYKEDVILKGVSVSDEEIRQHYEQHLSDFRSPSRVVIRQILMDSAPDARRVREQVARDPNVFEQVAQESSLAPDGGQPYALEEELLPEAVRAAVGLLREGEISPVVEDPQGLFIVRLEERQPARDTALEEAREAIELQLLQERGQARYREFVASLREKTKVELMEDRLGFPYTKRKPS